MPPTLTVTPTELSISYGDFYDNDVYLTANPEYGECWDRDDITWHLDNNDVLYIDEEDDCLIQLDCRNIGISDVTAKAWFFHYDEESENESDEYDYCLDLSATCTVRVLPDAPTQLNAATRGTKVTLTWEPGGLYEDEYDISGYKIYRADNKNGEYELIATVSAYTYSYTLSNVEYNKQYYYQVRSYASVYYSGHGTEQLLSDASNTVSATRKVSAPTIKSVKTSNGNSITVKWDAVSGVDGYKVYRATSKTGTYKLIKTLDGSKTTSYVNTELSTNTTYYYKVKSYVELDDKTLTSAYSGIMSSKTGCAKPTNLSISSTQAGKLSLSWDSVKKADGYKIYRSTSKTGTYSLVKTISGTKTLSYTNTGLKESTKYYYKVCAYSTINDSKVNGIFSDIVSKTTKASVIKLSKSSITVNAEKSSTVTVTYSGKGDPKYSVADSSIVFCSWNKQKTKLTLTPKAYGKTTIKIYDSKNSADYKTITYTYKAPWTIKLPNETDLYYGSRYFTVGSFKVTEIYQYDDGTARIRISYTCTCTDSYNPNESGYCWFAYKLYDSDGYVVKSGSDCCSALAPGESGKGDETFYLPKGDYTLKVLLYK